MALTTSQKRALTRLGERVPLEKKTQILEALRVMSEGVAAIHSPLLFVQSLLQPFVYTSSFQMISLAEFEAQAEVFMPHRVVGDYLNYEFQWKYIEGKFDRGELNTSMFNKGDAGAGEESEPDTAEPTPTPAGRDEEPRKVLPHEVPEVPNFETLSEVMQETLLESTTPDELTSHDVMPKDRRLGKIPPRVERGRQKSVKENRLVRTPQELYDYLSEVTSGIQAEDAPEVDTKALWDEIVAAFPLQDFSQVKVGELPPFKYGIGYPRYLLSLIALLKNAKRITRHVTKASPVRPGEIRQSRLGHHAPGVRKSNSVQRLTHERLF